MATHDPRREVEKLRALLASHDKPIALLFGAGASCAVSDPSGKPLIPAIAPLGQLCEEAVRALGAKYGAAWESIAADVEAKHTYSNIELILTAVRLKMAAAGPHDTLAGLDVPGLGEFEAAIRRTVARVARPEDSRIPQSLPHHALARWIRRTDRPTPVEIFTTNYDTLIERGLEDERVATFDGFVGSRQPFFHPQSLRHEELAPGRQWVRLWKIHGSVNWSWVTLKDGSRRIARGLEDGDGELILPSSHKYDESRKQPYVAMLERLHRVLTEREDGILITLGYSFGDEHINSVIFDALDVRDRLHVFSLQFADPADDHDLISRAKGSSNLVVYGRRRAAVGGVTGEWRLHEPVDRRLAPLMDIPFDSDASLPGDDKPSLTGSFRLGDFKWFAKFLDTIVGNYG
ncbi:hypothetical protein FHR72_002548 [Mycolicibacterium iranicum]|uniref:SIR2-like domain-containing protein n=1 Tax=Mycolicibacterium iranicum TaxID=912594 RepID=A0A839Q9G1_MYCIR|nr:SIR2 family protein [Mycolicibacterium iranicum]MBB2991075.1 hypothetical protein [Mycolicibacterium iranicum]